MAQMKRPRSANDLHLAGHPRNSCPPQISVAFPNQVDSTTALHCCLHSLVCKYCASVISHTLSRGSIFSLSQVKLQAWQPVCLHCGLIIRSCLLGHPLYIHVSRILVVRSFPEYEGATPQRAPSTYTCRAQFIFADLY